MANQNEIKEVSNLLSIANGMGATFGVDGNQFYFIVGHLPDPGCIVGFGDTPYQALSEFYNAFCSQRIKK